MTVFEKTSATSTSVALRDQDRVGPQSQPAIRSGANATTTRIAILRSSSTIQSTTPATSANTIKTKISALAAKDPASPILWNLSVRPAISSPKSEPVTETTPLAIQSSSAT